MASKVAVGAGLVVLAVYLLGQFRLVIAPLVLALILAYVLSPVAGALQHRLRMARGWATFLTYVIMLGLLSLILALLIPALADQLNRLNVNFPEISRAANELLARTLVIGGRTFDTTGLLAQISSSLQTLLEPVFSRTLDLALGVLTSFAWVVFILVVSFYLVRDSDRLGRWLNRIPSGPYREELGRLAQEISAVWAAFFRGQLTLALVVGVIWTLLGIALGLPYFLAMGVLAGLLEFLPSLGHTIWLFIASLLMFFQGSTWMPVPPWVAMLIVVGLHILFGQVDLNYLIPRIVGRRVRLHPLVVILGIVAGASLAGVLGILLAAPTIATARVVGRYLLANLLDQDPFPLDLPSEDRNETVTAG